MWVVRTGDVGQRFTGRPAVDGAPRGKGTDHRPVKTGVSVKVRVTVGVSRFRLRFVLEYG